MFTPLAKLAIGLSATMATAFYYLAAAPPASAVDVCGPGNFSSECAKAQASSEQSATTSSSAASLRNPVQQEQVVESSPAVIPDPVQQEQVVESSPAVIPDPVQQEQVVESSPAVIPDPVQQEQVVESPPADPVQEVPATEPPLTAPAAGDLGNIYTTSTSEGSRATIPEPGTVVGLMVTGAGIICSGRRRNKQVGQQR
ncbi:PEP-CTERM sorting domain-containing protein [Microcoleus sp. K4-C2]|uniref:PEP-CTERM sorting domain-containing protein n=1 Tax=Microcoleus sp. K4-C2 TaxID=2818792 RepID=UPI002FD3BD1F